MHPSRLILLSAAALLSSAITAQSSDRALYRVEFDATWSSATHPGAYPVNAHFSPLIGATHSDSLSVWGPGQMATPGIEVMAETGGTFTLSQELNSAIGAGTAGQLITGGGAGAPGSAFSTFTVTGDHSLVSLVTMIAPSPDWFVGVHNLNLLEGGVWVDELVVELDAYDSGTDSGANFTSGNLNTNPAQPISPITTGPFFANQPLGTFTFTRVASTLVYGCANPAGSLEVTSGIPTLGGSVALALDDPTQSLATPAATFIAFSLNADSSFPCGTIVPGLGLGAPGTSGEVLIDSIFLLQSGAAWNGSPTVFPLSIPSSAGLADVSIYAQGVLADSNRIAVTNAVELALGI